MSTKQKKDSKSSAKIATTGFVSFSDVVSKDESNTSSGGLTSQAGKGKALTPVYTGDHSDLNVACKKILKRDMTTRLKALIDMIAILRGVEDPSHVLPDFLPFFTFAFSKLVYDESWHVREKTGQLLLTVIEKDKQSLGPFMKDSIGPWWQLASDPVKEVSDKFTTAFANAIPVKRRPMVLVHLAPHLLKYIDKGLKLETAELKEMTQCSTEELDEKYERLIASLIDCTGKLIEALSAEQNQSIATQGVSSSADLAADLDAMTYKDIFHVDSLFKHMKSTYVSVRRALYKLIALAAERIPIVLIPHNELISQFLLTSLDEKFDTNAEEGLYSVVRVSTNLPGFWSKGSIVNQLVQKLRAIKKTKAEMLSNYLLPILASVPPSKLGIYIAVGEDASKGIKVFQSFLNLVGDLVEPETATASSSSASSAAGATTGEQMLTCAIETLTFLALRKIGEDKSQFVLQVDRLEQLLQLLVRILVSYFQSQELPDAVPMKDISPFMKTIAAFHRNTVQQSHVSAAEWNRLLWTPLAQQLRVLQATALQIFVSKPAENTPEILQGSKVLLTFLKLADDGVVADFSEAGEAIGINRTLHLLVSDLMTFFRSDDDSNLIPMLVTMNTLSSCLINSKATSWTKSVLSNLMKLTGPWTSLVLRFLKKSFAHQDLSIITSRTFEAFLKDIVVLQVGAGTTTWITCIIRELEQNASVEGFYLLLRQESLRNWKAGSIWHPSVVQALTLCGMYCLSPSSLTENISSLPTKWEHFQTAIDSRDGRFKIKFLLLLSSTPGLEALGLQLIQHAMKLWNKKTSRVAVMFLFHITARILKDESMKGRFSGCVLLHDAEWLDNPNYQVLSKLQSLFFGRDRNATFATKYQDYIDSLGNTTIPLDSWQSIEDHLLPALSTLQQCQWLTGIARILNASFEGKAVTCSDEFGTEQELSASKWSRHAHKYIAIRKALAIADNKECQIDLLVTQALFWKQVGGNQEWFVSANVERVLQCTYEFTYTASEVDFGDLLLEYDTFLYFSFAFATLLKNSSLSDSVQALTLSIQEQSIQKSAQFLIGNKRDTWLQGLVQSLLTDSSVLDVQVAEVCIQILQHLLTIFYPVDPTAVSGSTSNNTRLNFPLPAILSCKDHEGYYIAQQAQTSTSIQYVKTKQAMFENVFSLSATPMKLQACHLENGPAHPYYSLRLSTDNKKELQTEWNRLLVVSSVATGIDNIVMFQDTAVADLAAESTVLVLSSIHHVFRDLLTALKSDVLGCSSSIVLMEKGLNWSLQHKRLDLMSLLFASLVQSIDAAHSMLEDVATMRGLIVLLTSDRFISNPSVLQLAKKLLKIVLSAQVGVGHGLWLSHVIKHVYQSPVLQLSAKELSSKAMDVTAVMCHTMDLIATVLDVMECPSLLTMLETKLLPSLLQRLEECTELPCHLQGVLAKVMRIFWANQSQQRSQANNNELYDTSNPVKAWELTSFQYLFESLLQRASLLDSKTPAYLQLEALENQWDAVQALHFAMLGRTRESSSHIMRSIRFGQHLSAVTAIVFPSSDRPSTAFSETYRTTFCKLYDQWLVSGEMWDHVQLEEEETEKKKEVTSSAPLPEHLIPHSFEEFEQEDPDNEAHDNERDAHMFHLVLGDSLSEQLSQRFSLDRIYQRMESELHSRLSTACATEDSMEGNNMAENDNEEEEEFNEDVQELLSTASVTSRTTVNKKILFKSMVKMDGLGSVLAWLLTMQSIDAMSIKHWNARARCGNYLKTSGTFKQAMDFLVHLSGDLCKYKEVAATFQRAVYMNLPPAVLCHLKLTADIEACSLQQLAIYALFRTICTLPAMFRNYWNDSCKRVDKGKLSRFVEERVRLSILKREVALIHIATKAKRWDTNEFEVKGNTTSGEITAFFLRDETKIEITIKMPPSYPLKNVEVNCTSRIGVSDGRWRRWVLQMIQLLSMQDGSVVDAALLWKSNIEKELEGVEPCPICYCILHTKTLKLPTLGCPTCKHKFHPTCLHTWFKTSGKSKCVLCQQPMFF